MSETRFAAPENTEIERYLDMERTAYAQLVAGSEYHTEDFVGSDSAEMVVGSYVLHEAYDYEERLLGGVRVSASALAIEYGCGPGRMLLRLAPLFARVDGVDISPEVIEVARRRCAHLSNPPFLSVTNGQGLPGALDSVYDVAYSVICLQHICVHAVRRRILEDLYRALRPGGLLTFQMGYGVGHAGGVPYEADFTTARGTNGVMDVTVLHPAEIAADLTEIGFVDAAYMLTPAGPSDIHAAWIFVRAVKPGDDALAIELRRDEWAARGFQPLRVDDVAVARARRAQSHPFALLARHIELEDERCVTERRIEELERQRRAVEGHVDELERQRNDSERRHSALEQRMLEVTEDIQTLAAYVGRLENQFRRVVAADRPRIQQLVDNLIGKRASQRVGILGAGAHTAFLLQSTALASHPQLFLFDNNPDTWGTDVRGHAVRRPSDIPSLSLDVIVVSSLAFQEEMVAQLEKLNLSSVQIVRCYS